VTLVSAWHGNRHNAHLAILLIAFGTPQPANNIGKVCIPPGERCQCMRIASAGMATRALQKNRVLPEFIAEFRDFRVAHAVLYKITVVS
jgi:hypothetical protein